MDHRIRAICDSFYDTYEVRTQGILRCSITDPSNNYRTIYAVINSNDGVEIYRYLADCCVCYTYDCATHDQLIERIKFMFAS